MISFTSSLTAEQEARLATMDETDAKCWMAWYTEQNDLVTRERIATRTAILVEMNAAGLAEPAAVRKAVGVANTAFNEAVRTLKRMGRLHIDEAGLMVAGRA